MWDTERSECQLPLNRLYDSLTVQPGLLQHCWPSSSVCTVCVSVSVCECVCVCVTHSLSRGTEVRLLLFWTMLAWLRREMRRVEGASRQGSPSTYAHKETQGSRSKQIN